MYDICTDIHYTYMHIYIYINTLHAWHIWFQHSVLHKMKWATPHDPKKPSEKTSHHNGDGLEGWFMAVGLPRKCQYITLGKL